MSTTETLEIAAKAVQLYAESHPRPHHVTQAQAADMLELSRPTVSKLVKSGILQLNECGLIPIEQIDRALAKRGQNSPKITQAGREAA